MELPPGQRRFVTTRWSLIVAAGDSAAPESREAIAALCETYWWPVYAFIRRSGKDADSARDLTQGFFARVLEKQYFKDAKRERGRFRSFLLTAVKNFLANEYDFAVAAKRGGGQPHLALEFDDGELRYSREPADKITPEDLYERQWAHTVLAAAMVRLETGLPKGERRELFLALKPALTGDDLASYATLARRFKTTDGALRVAVHRLRRQFGDALRETIGETVEQPEEVDDELRHLLAVVGR
jgi:DNA-directed RNA polymerase specialized sigma24 family protein